MKSAILTVIALLGFAMNASADELAKLGSVKALEQIVKCSQAITPATQYIDYQSIDGSPEGSEALKMPLASQIADGTEVELRALVSKYRKTLVRQLSAVTAPTVLTAAELNNGRASVKENFRKALISANHPCSEVSDANVRTAFQNAGDAVVEGFIRYNQKSSGYETANRSAASNSH